LESKHTVNPKNDRKAKDTQRDAGSEVSKELPPTLARRITELRERKNLTVKDLAKDSRFSKERIEEIESGLETWLSSTDRQLLARALAVDPYIIQEVEARPRLEESDDPVRYAAILADLADSILKGVKEQECPQCGNTLRCRVQEGLDIEEQPIYFAKAFCQKCPFILK
jgi:transcriptional regulator with XRE-family HTH domain